MKKKKKYSADKEMAEKSKRDGNEGTKDQKTYQREEQVEEENHSEWEIEVDDIKDLGDTKSKNELILIKFA